jgi:hypothetical protein
MFIGLLVLGLTNLLKAKRLGKLENGSILMFYVSAMIVIVSRVLLFADPIFNWPLAFYLGYLMSFPTVIYLFVGFSQVMISLEIIIGYKNLAHRENLNLKVEQRNQKIARNNKLLKYIFWGSAIFGVLAFLYFTTFTLILLLADCDADTCNNTSQYVL